jgi:hypothetical protein
MTAIAREALVRSGASTLLATLCLIASGVADACTPAPPPRAVPGECFGNWAVQCRPRPVPDRGGAAPAESRTVCSITHSERLFGNGIRQVDISAAPRGPESLSFFALGAHPNASLRIAGVADAVALDCTVVPPTMCMARTTCTLPPARFEAVLQDLLRSASATVVYGDDDAFPVDLSRFREAWSAYQRARQQAAGSRPDRQRPARVR